LNKTSKDFCQILTVGKVIYDEIMHKACLSLLSPWRSVSGSYCCSWHLDYHICVVSCDLRAASYIDGP